MHRVPLVAVVGNVVVDYVATVDEFPEREQVGHLLYTREPLGPHIGGNGGIFAVAAERIGLRVRLSGAIGNDSQGAWLAKGLGPLAGEALLRRKGPTAATAVIVDRFGERTFLHSPGVGAELDPDDLLPAFLTGADWLHLCSFFILPKFTARRTTDLFRAAQRRGIHTCLDPAWDPTGSWDLRGLLRYVDLFLPNLAEAEAITGMASPPEASQALLAEGAGTVVIKLGASGSYLARHGEPGFYIPPFHVKSVDGTGAGDCFGAALLAMVSRWRGSAKGKVKAKGQRKTPRPRDLPFDALQRAVLAANGAGAMATTGLGGTAAAPTSAALLAFISEHRADLPTPVDAPPRAAEEALGPEGVDLLGGPGQG